jgi:hypothetical protein
MEWGLQSALAGVSYSYSDLNLDCGLPKKKTLAGTGVFATEDILQTILDEAEERSRVLQDEPTSV